jgi:hypothetical protein
MCQICVFFLRESFSFKMDGWHAHDKRGHVNSRENMLTTSVGMLPKSQIIIFPTVF